MSSIQGHKRTALLIMLVGLLIFVASFVVPPSGAILQNGQVVFGNTNVGSYQDPMSANIKGASYFVASDTGTLSAIRAYMCYQTTTGNARAGLYDWNGQLVATSNEVALPSSFAWVNFPIPTAPTITSGTGYWLAILRQTDAWIAADPTISNNLWNPNPYSNGFSSYFGDNPSSSPIQLSIYGVIQTSTSPTSTPSTNPTSTPVTNTLFTLTVADSPTNGGIIQFASPPHQAIDLNHATYYAGSAIALQADPTSGFKFDHWTVVPTNGGTTITIFNNPLPPQNIESDLTITAFYTTVVPTATPTATPIHITGTSSSYATDMQIVGGVIAAIGAIYYVMPKKTVS